MKYYKADPPKPEPPVLSPKVGGMGIKCKAVPSDCIGVRYYINDDSVYSKNNTLSYSCEAGVYDVTCAYVDMFGDGPTSGQSTCTVKTVIDESMIADEAISSAKLDKIVQNNISNATANANAALSNSNITADKLKKDYSTTKQTEALISSQVASYTDGKLSGYSTIEQTHTAISNVVVKMDAATNKKLESYSTIQQTQDAISLAVKDIDLDGNTLISKINLANGSILLDGKIIHITGQTLFDDNIVTKKMLQAGSVDADKIKVDSLSAICATIGTLRTATSGARLEIKDNLLEVYDSNNVLRVRMGVW